MPKKLFLSCFLTLFVALVTYTSGHAAPDIPSIETFGCDDVFQIAFNGDSPCHYAIDPPINTWSHWFNIDKSPSHKLTIDPATIDEAGVYTLHVTVEYTCPSTGLKDEFDFSKIVVVHKPVRQGGVQTGPFADNDMEGHIGDGGVSVWYDSSIPDSVHLNDEGLVLSARLHEYYPGGGDTCNDYYDMTATYSYSADYEMEAFTATYGPEIHVGAGTKFYLETAAPDQVLIKTRGIGVKPSGSAANLSIHLPGIGVSAPIPQIGSHHVNIGNAFTDTVGFSHDSSSFPHRNDRLVRFVRLDTELAIAVMGGSGGRGWATADIRGVNVKMEHQRWQFLESGGIFNQGARPVP